MIDIDKVIKGLTQCTSVNTQTRCHACPYWGSKDGFSDCDGMKDDALQLLKEHLKWIPVSERLPKKPYGYQKCELRRMYFLVSLESGCVESLGFDFDDNRWHTTGSPVVAWMKLPEPYTEGR